MVDPSSSSSAPHAPEPSQRQAHESSDRSPRQHTPTTARGFFAVLALFVVHVLLTSYFEPADAIFTKSPLSGSDFDTHIEQTWRVIEGLQGWGKTWVYDVHLLAGHPNGVIFDADNKGWEYLTYGLMQLGLHRGFAFNVFVLLAHLLVVPIGYVSARLFGLTERAALTCAALVSGIWLFDSYTHWIWWVGTIAFAFASYFAMLPLALFHRYMETKRALHAALTALTLGISLLIHPYTFIVLVVPLAALYLRDVRTLGKREHVSVAGIVLFAFALNAEWLYSSLAQWHYILNSAYFGRAHPFQLLADYFGVLIDTSTTGILPTRTSVRFLGLGAACVTLVYYRRHADRRFLPLTAALLANLAFAYFAFWSKFVLQVQPYRFVGSAIFIACIPAGALVTLLRTHVAWSTLPTVLRGAVLALALVAAQNIGRDAVSFFPTLLPDVPPLLDDLPSPVTSSGYPPFATYRHVPDQPFFWELPKWVDANDNGRGRFLVQNGAIGEQLAWKTDAEILGGFTLRNVEHAYANLFRRRLEQKLTPQQVRAYLEAYAVEWVVLTFEDDWFATMPELFEPHATVAGHVVLRTKVPISRFQENSGEIAAATNRIAVVRSDPKRDVVLRYHFHEQLVCGPKCRVVPSKNPVGGVPFIRVPAPHPASFVVHNTYGVPAAR